MAISSETSSVTYAGNNSTVTAYTLAFPFSGSTEIVVTHITAAGVRSVLAITTGYTLQGDPIAGTGTLKTVAAIPLADSLLIERFTSAVQSLDSSSPAGSYPTSIETQLDRSTRALQDGKRIATRNFARSLRVPDGETAAELPASTLRAGEVIYFNATTGAIETKTPDEILALSSGVPDGIGLPAGGTAGQYLQALGGGTGAWATITASSIGAVEGDGTGIDEPGAFVQMLDVQGDGIDAINSQPFCSKKISTWVTAASPPLRQAVVGDSLSVFGGRVGLGPWMGRAGCIGLETRNTTGTVTNHVGPSGSNRPDIWFTGTGTTFAIGSSAEFTDGASATGDIRGNRACIGYIRGPGKGTFDLQYQANATGAWTTLATINTANATADGVFATYNLPTTNFPFYRLRVNNVTGGVVDLAPVTGIYNSTGGGVIEMRIGSAGGLDLSTHIPATPAAVFDPIWTGLAPDYVISIWADAAADWESGGAFRTFYNRCTAAFASTDWIQVSRNPSSEPEGIPASIAIAREQAAAQRAWALETRHTFINGHELTGGSWTVSNARGLAGDVVHPSVAGATHRDIVLWSKLPLGQIYLGGGFRTGQFTPLFNQASTAQDVSQPALFTAPLEAPSLRFPDASTPLDASRTGVIRKVTTGSNRQLFFQEATTVGGYFDFGSGLIGFYPGGDNWAFGSVTTRWNAFVAGISARQRTITASANVVGTDHTLFCDATSGAITVNLPAAASHNGRILAVVKTDASGNAVTIDGNAAETINGAANLVLAAQWDRAQIQSNGTNWIRI